MREADNLRYAAFRVDVVVAVRHYRRLKTILCSADYITNLLTDNDILYCKASPATKAVEFFHHLRHGQLDDVLMAAPQAPLVFASGDC